MVIVAEPTFLPVILPLELTVAYVVEEELYDRLPAAAEPLFVTEAPTLTILLYATDLSVALMVCVPLLTVTVMVVEPLV